MSLFFDRTRGRKLAPTSSRRDPKARRGARRDVAYQPCQAMEMRLEDRLLLAQAQWVELGPAPIVNAQLPGPPQAASGRLAGVAASPTDPSTYYVAAAGGGVWKTTNAGASWKPMTDSQQTLAMGAIAVAPTNGNILYAGTGEADNSGDSQPGVGILRSTDAGATWTLSQGPGNIFFNSGLTTSKIAVDPTNPNVVYAAMANLGENKGFRAGTGIYKSTDGGVTWANTTASINTNVAYSDVAINPKSPSTLTMAIGSVFGSNDNGVYQSTNAGQTWTLLNIGKANTDFGRISVAVSPSNPQVVYTTVESVSTSGVLLVARTDNGGTSWTDVTPSVNYMGGQGWYDQWASVNPTNSANVFVGGSAGDSSPILESLDSGATWSQIGQSSSSNGSNGPHADHHAAAWTSDGKLIEGNDGGIWRLDDPTPSSIKWTDLNAAISTIQFQGIALDPADPTIALGGSQDNGTERYSGSLGWTLTDGGDGGEVAFDQQDPTIAYHVAPIASFGPNDYFRKSTDGGKTWGSYASGLPNSGADEAGPGQSTNFYPPFVLDPNNGQRLILGSSDLYLSTDGANSWTNLTAGKSGWPSTDPTNALAISTTNGGNTIYAAIGGGSGTKLLVSSDGGQTWTTRNLPSGTGTISDLQIDPTNDQVAYAVTSSFGSNPGHVFQTINRGASWTSISANLPDLPTWTLQIDPNTPGTLYVGNDTGVSYTINGGSSWATLGTGLPHAQVLQLDLNAAFNTLGAATHGRGMFEIPTPGVLVTIVNPASATPNPVTSTSTRLSVLAADPSGESTLTYTWSTTSAPVGVRTPTFSANGTNAAKSDTATFYAVGQYTFQVRVKNLQGQTVVSSVTVNVDPVFQSLAISPSKQEVPAGGTLQFNASGADQFGNPITSSNISATWAVTSGTGTVSTTGLYTAPASGTIATVTATSGVYTRSATVYVLSNPWGQSDVGSPVTTGYAADNNAGTFTILGAGTGIAGTSDQFQFAYQPLTGNSTIIAKVVSEQNVVKAGVMFRADTSPNAPYVLMFFVPGKGISFQYRSTTLGGTTIATVPGSSSSYYLELVRTGNLFVGSYSLDGKAWTQDGPGVTIAAMGATIDGGLASTSGTPSTIGTTIFGSVAEDAVPTIVATASVSPSPVTTRTAALSVLGGDAEGESVLTYTWTTTARPLGAPAPTYSVNGTNAAKNDVVSFAKSGVYTLTVTATNPLGYSVSSSVTVLVVQTLATLRMTPTTVSLTAGGQQQFTTSLLDQFGVPLAKQPIFTYSIIAGGVGGKITSNGLYTAPSNRSGIDRINVTGGGQAAVATVTVTFGAGVAVREPVGPTQATVSLASVGWGAAGSASLVTAADGLRLLPIGRSTDLPWANIQSLTITLSQARPLSASDVKVTGLSVADYGPVTVTPVAGSTASYLITLARPIASADRLTLTVGNAGLATFTRRLDVLPGDVNDDGIVTQADATIASGYLTSLFIAADILGEGPVTTKGVKMIQLLNGTRLPGLTS